MPTYPLAQSIAQWWFLGLGLTLWYIWSIWLLMVHVGWVEFCLTHSEWQLYLTSDNSPILCPNLTSLILSNKHAAPLGFSFSLLSSAFPPWFPAFYLLLFAWPMPEVAFFKAKSCGCVEGLLTVRSIDPFLRISYFCSQFILCLIPPNM